MAKEIKCIVWDLDNTIWDGTLLESESVSLKPGIRDVIKCLDERGILQSIASKNNHSHAVDKLKEFGLFEYFLYPEISWNSKSSSIANIQRNLNLHIETFAFVDDDIYERDEVNVVHKDLLCIDSINYNSIPDMSRFMPAFITEDSKVRRQMYMHDILRNNEEVAFQGPTESFLASLDMEFIISEAQEYDLQRAEELTVRTNQLNATGKTYDYDELNYFRQSPNHKLYICELNDKYGTYGKIGLALVEVNEQFWHLKLMLMSCRVISRGVGTVLLSYIMNNASKDGKVLRADFKKTDRNRMMLITYRFANFKEISDDGNGVLLLENDLEFIQTYPAYIDIKIK